MKVLGNAKKNREFKFVSDVIIYLISLNISAALDFYTNEIEILTIPTLLVKTS